MKIYILAEIKEEMPEEVKFDCQESVENILREHEYTIINLVSHTEQGD